MFEGLACVESITRVNEWLPLHEALDSAFLGAQGDFIAVLHPHVDPQPEWANAGRDILTAAGLKAVLGDGPELGLLGLHRGNVNPDDVTATHRFWQEQWVVDPGFVMIPEFAYRAFKPFQHTSGALDPLEVFAMSVAQSDGWAAGVAKVNYGRAHVNAG